MKRFVDGNRIQLLRNGEAFFPALEAAINNAKHEIYIQTYIYKTDVIGIRIGEALKKAAQRGVTVNIMIDGFGSKDLSKDFVQTLEDAGVRVLFFRPKISAWTLKKSRLRRLHSKVTMVDGKIGFVGGINIVDDYNIPQEVAPRIDYAVQVEGEIMSAISVYVRRSWRMIATMHFHYFKDPAVRALSTDVIPDGIKAAFVYRDNLLHRRDIEKAYLSAIGNARTEVIIANAYFFPGRKFRRAILNAASRGVQVTLLLQGRLEYFLMRATYAFYRDFLNNGIHIYEYTKSYMHSKVAVIDGEWATVGSSNIDPFSLLMAREANLIVKDKAFADELRADIFATIAQGAQKVDLKTWGSMSIAKRLGSRVLYGLVRAFLGLIGYAKQH